MKPKQKAPKKSADINSAPVKRLLKWITTTISSTGGVTYTQVKNFINSKEQNSAFSYDVKDILKTFLDHGRLQKTGYKFVLPQSPNRKQVAKKTTNKKITVKRLKPKQNVPKSFPVIEVKRSPGILDIRDIVTMQENASNKAIFPPTIYAEIPPQATDADLPSQTMEAEEPTQTFEAEEPIKNPGAAVFKRYLISEAEEPFQKPDAAIPAQTEETTVTRVSRRVVGTELTE